MKTIIDECKNEITVKKSKFIGHIYKVCSRKEAEKLILENKKKYYDAKHNCYCYRIYENDNIIEKASDDGEPSQTAGAPMLEIVKKQDIINCLIIVTRYFGGILLGTGGLVRAYSDTAKECIETAKIRDVKIGNMIEYIIKYEDLNRFQYLCGKYKLKVEDIEYENNIKILIKVEKDLKEVIDENIPVIQKQIKEKNILI